MSDGIESQRAPEAVGAYPHARRVGNLLFLSGVGPRKRGTKDIPGVALDADGKMVDYDIEAQRQKIINAGLAHNFGTRLLLGI